MQRAPLRRINDRRQGSLGKLGKVLNRPPFGCNKASNLPRILTRGRCQLAQVSEAPRSLSRPLLPSRRFWYPNCGEKVRVLTFVSVHSEARTALFFRAEPVPAFNASALSALPVSLLYPQAEE